MSDGPMLQRYLGSREGREPVREPVADDCGAFGQLRGIQSRALMLELRLRNGRIRAVGYGWLDRAEYDPAEGITLCVAGEKICIKGRNLNTEMRSLFEGITRHKVLWIQEASRAEGMQADENEAVIEAIEW